MEMARFPLARLEMGEYTMHRLVTVAGPQLYFQRLQQSTMLSEQKRSSSVYMANYTSLCPNAYLYYKTIQVTSAPVNKSSTYRPYRIAWFLPKQDTFYNSFIQPTIMAFVSSYNIQSTQRGVGGLSSFDFVLCTGGAFVYFCLF